MRKRVNGCAPLCRLLTFTLPSTARSRRVLSPRRIAADIPRHQWVVLRRRLVDGPRRSEALALGATLMVGRYAAQVRIFVWVELVCK